MIKLNFAQGAGLAATLFAFFSFFSIDLSYAQDTNPPVISCPEGSPLTYSVMLFDCTTSFSFTIPDPVIEDDSTSFEVAISIIDTILVPQGCFGDPGRWVEVTIENDLNPGDHIPGLERGTYSFRYMAIDENNDTITVLDCPFQVVDSIPPTAACDDQFTIHNLNNETGITIYPEEIDEGSNDNCSEVSLEIRLAGGTWGPSLYLDYDCDNIGDTITIELRAGDDANWDGTPGGEGDLFRVCYFDVELEDLTPPSCVAPADISTTCGIVNALGIDWNNTEQLNEIYGLPTALDNCSATAVQTDVIINTTDCGWGTVIRRFSATDASGLTSTNLCEQKISIFQGLTAEVSGEDTFCSDTINHQAGVPIIFNVHNTCGTDSIAVNGSYDLNADGTLDGDASITFLYSIQNTFTYAIGGHFPEGNHLYHLLIENTCNDYITVDIPFAVIDCRNAISISGKVTTETGTTIEGCPIFIPEGTPTVGLTSATGEYSFFLTDPNIESYTLSPNWDVYPNLSVSTADIGLIAKHILGKVPLNSPYKRIAADVNRSGSITVQDIIALRQFILGNSNHFPNNNFWRFVDAGYVFQNTNPFLEPFPEVITLQPPGEFTSVDFIGIPIGDVNQSAVVNGVPMEDDRYGGTFTITTKKQLLRAGNSYKIDFFANDLVTIDGFQFTLNFNQSALEYNGIKYGIAQAENFGLNHLNQGIITTSWNPFREKISRGRLFSLVVNAKKDARLSDLIQITSRITRAEAYRNQGIENVVLDFTPASSTFRLLPNVPNPFAEATRIRYVLPAKESITITLRDISGRTLGVFRQDGEKGINELSVSGKDIPNTGVIFYTVSTKKDSKTGRMIVQ